MVLMIGLVTLTALIWILAHSMACESGAEKRRLSREGGIILPSHHTEARERFAQAA